MQRDSLMTFLVRIPVILFSFLYSIFLIRMLGPEGNGLYSFLMASVGLSILVFGLDASKSTLYHIASKEFDTGKVISLSFLVFGASSGIIVVILGLLYLFQNPVSYFFIPKEYFELFYILFFIGSFICQHFTKLFRTILIGQKLFRAYNFFVFAISLVQVILYGGGYVAVTYFVQDRNFHYLFSYILFAQLVILLLSWFLYYKTVKVKLRSDHTDIQSGYLKYAGLSFYNEVGHFLNKRIDVWFIEVYSGIKSLGIYSLASQMTNFLLLFVDPIEDVMKTYLIGMRRSTANKVFMQYFRLTFYLVGLLCALLFLFSPWIIPLFFGNKFVGAVIPLRILSLGVIFVTCKRMLINYNRAFNDLKINIGAQWAGVIITIILDVILIPEYGITGAAWASVFAYFITAFILAIDLSRRQGIRIIDLFIFKPDDVELVKSLVRNYMKKLS